MIAISPYALIIPALVLVYLALSLSILRFLALVFFMSVTFGTSLCVSLVLYGFMLYQGEKVATFRHLYQTQTKNIHYYLSLAGLLSCIQGAIFPSVTNSRAVAWLALFMSIIAPSLLCVFFYMATNRTNKKISKEIV
jgi:hypothetical protein